MPKPVGMCAQGLVAPVCPGRHFRRIPVPCPWADSETRSTNCGENSWSRHSDKGDRVSTVDLDRPAQSHMLIPLHFMRCPPPPSPSPQGYGYGTVLCGRLRYIMVRRGREICPVGVCLLCAWFGPLCPVPSGCVHGVVVQMHPEGRQAHRRGGRSRPLSCGCQPTFYSCL